MHGEAYRQSFVNVSANFHLNTTFDKWTLGLWTTFLQIFMKIGTNKFLYIYKQTNKQSQERNLLLELAQRFVYCMELHILENPLGLV